MVSAVNKCATRVSMAEYVQWIGTDSSFKQIEKWCGADVKRSGDTLVIQTKELTERVNLGDFIIEVSGSYYPFSPKDFHTDFIKVSSD